jgi:hypothetical protein
MAASMGLRSGGELLQFADSAGDMASDFSTLAASTIAAGEGFKRLADDAGKSLSEFDKLKNQFKTTLAETIPAPILQLLSEVSSSGTGLAAGGFLAGLAGRGLGKVPILGGLLRSLPLIGGAFGTAATKTAAAPVAQAASGGLGRAAAGVAGRGAGFLSSLMGPLALALTPTTLGGSEEAPGAAEARRAAAPRATMIGFDQLAHMEGGRLYRNENPISSALFGVDWDAVWKDRARAEAHVSQVYGIKPGSQIPVGEVGDFDTRMAGRQITAAEIAAAEAAKLEAARADMSRYQMMGMGAGYLMPTMTVTPPANSNSAPRPLPPDKVTEAMATGKY